MNIEELVRSRLTVVRKSGSELEACCPNPQHSDRSPSFRYNVDKNVFICFGCGIKGGLKHFLQLTGGGELEFDVQSDILKAKIRDLDSKIVPQKTYSNSWLAQFDIENPYWTRTRRLSPTIVKKFRLGYDPIVNAVTIPIFTEDKIVLGVIKRILNPSKQRYTQPLGFIKQRHLFAGWAIQGESHVAVVEGPVDALACWSAGIPAVACLGSNMSEWQARILVAQGITSATIWTDNDGAGEAASNQYVERLSAYPLFVSVAGYSSTMPSDPAACSEDQRHWAMDHAKRVKGPS